MNDEEVCREKFCREPYEENYYEKHCREHAVEYAFIKRCDEQIKRDYEGKIVIILGESVVASGRTVEETQNELKRNNLFKEPYIIMDYRKDKPDEPIDI